MVTSFTNIGIPCSSPTFFLKFTKYIVHYATIVPNSFDKVTETLFDHGISRMAQPARWWYKDDQYTNKFATLILISFPDVATSIPLSYILS